MSWIGDASTAVGWAAAGHPARVMRSPRLPAEGFAGPLEKGSNRQLHDGHSILVLLFCLRNPKKGRSPNRYGAEPVVRRLAQMRFAATPGRVRSRAVCGPSGMRSRWRDSPPPGRSSDALRRGCTRRCSARSVDSRGRYARRIFGREVEEAVEDRSGCKPGEKSWFRIILMMLEAISSMTPLPLRMSNQGSYRATVQG